ncbi:hypothetical protein HYW42_01475 [Candidatus Daviesbacteria bacterium]|nr:hypothetical protein [Candidatus Daviesbacteria bacterium]
MILKKLVVKIIVVIMEVIIKDSLKKSWLLCKCQAIKRLTKDIRIIADGIMKNCW